MSQTARIVPVRGKRIGHRRPSRGRLEAPMALAITQRRLITLKLGTPLGLGIAGRVKELVSAVSLAVETFEFLVEPYVSRIDAAAVAVASEGLR